MISLVTGASGFLGGRLAQLLCAREGRVRVLLRGEVPPHLRDLPIEIARGRLEDRDSLVAALRDVGVVYHCAALSADYGPWEAFAAANITGVGNLLAACERTGSLHRLVHVSTDDVYGYPVVPCDETGPVVETKLPYNRSKVRGERLVQSAASRLPVTIVRPTTIYGPRSKDFVAEIAQLLRGGTMPLIAGGRGMGGFIYVDDVAEAMIQAAATPATLGQTYNLAPAGAVRDATWSEYVRLLAAGIGLSPRYVSLPLGLALFVGGASEAIYKLLRIRQRPVLTRHAVLLLARDKNLPTDKAQRDFGFAPRVTLQEGVARSAAWLRETGSPP